ncbi:hypothetical protein CKAN_02595500 [Cinnamomum micranthum f. kanehirae]|uniref:Uncharacterized protein n=1 Tax=Cinnamomum micranthum f. kanehirae TaxID=337451 RepID=A0A443Q0L6_9MAGN|nr:hypothetical protein CKAN_02595500 [Cinnamomum micranthum f. kanehirae]
MLRDGECAGTAGCHDAKRKAPSEIDTRYFTVNLSEDDDMQFSSNLNTATDELAQESDIVFRKYLDAVESDADVEAINVEDYHPTPISLSLSLEPSQQYNSARPADSSHRVKSITWLKDLKEKE